MTDIADKLRKLLELAEHPNTNANEAANAAALAAKLSIMHNIELDSVRLKSQNKEFVSVLSTWHYSPRDAAGVIVMSQWVAQLFGCKILLAGSSSRRYIWFYGQKHNVDMCNSWSKYLIDSCARANREHARDAKRATFAEREDARSAFRYAFNVAVATRLREKLEAMKKEGVQEGSSSGTALVVSNWFEQERKEVQEFIDNNVQISNKTVSTRSVAIEGRAIAAGREAGNKVSLHDQVSTSKREAIA